MAITGSKPVKYHPGSKVTFKSAAAITAGRLVEITAANTVGMAAATSQKVVGFAMQSCDAAGDQIEVQLLGYVVGCTAAAPSPPVTSSSSARSPAPSRRRPPPPRRRSPTSTTPAQ
jgi:hypothetical protein